MAMRTRTYLATNIGLFAVFRPAQHFSWWPHDSFRNHVDNLDLACFTAKQSCRQRVGHAMQVIASQRRHHVIVQPVSHHWYLNNGGTRQKSFFSYCDHPEYVVFFDSIDVTRTDERIFKYAMPLLTIKVMPHL